MEYPLVKQYGGVALKPEAAFQPDPALNYKVLFDIRETSNDAGEVNQGLDHVAKLFNLLAPAKIKPGDTAVVAILHGPAVVAALNDENYRKKFGIANPNSALIKELTRYGVKICACAQTMAKQEIAYNSLHEDVALALSSLTVMINCQLENFAYVPFN